MFKPSLKNAKIMRSLVIIALVVTFVNVLVAAYFAAAYGGVYAVGCCIAAVIALTLNLYSLFALDSAIKEAEHG